MAITDTLTTREAVRRAVLDDLVERADEAATEMEGGPLDGIRVVSLGTLREQVAAALAVDLPPASDKYAEVVTPAMILVNALCPECGLPSGIAVKLTPQLVVDDDGAELKVKAKSKARLHVCGQLPLPVGDQETLDGAIEDLQLPILRAIAVVNERWDRVPPPKDPHPVLPPTLDAIARELGLESESDRADLEDTLTEWARDDREGIEPVVLVLHVKGSPVHYALTHAGERRVAAAAESDQEGEAA